MPLTIGCAARPGKARRNLTGSWRVFRPVFRPEECTKCGLCATVCPEGCVIETEEGTFIPDYDYCKGCGLCAEECPAKAIEMVQEEK
ncbi:MAG: 4Fe-4S binding protein [Methanomicrobiaceae archaeon]|uniref:Pyruvate:ferredoxin oxidoreductase, delta subunit n=1 Tax=hydrocarbon metagenome TaxID=938273 RepID=A0A0W8FJQ7_9ZZZZ|nr:4Fe-4S binding protein [Methanomicrobiaceae archaeon]MDD5420119.1 4Fe-4S binding protein [Methanomicrobiaceae archaeon]